MKPEKNIKTSLLGILLLLLLVGVILVKSYPDSDPIVKYLSVAVYGIIKLGLIFYGQTQVKRLNRNYTLWSALLFFITSLSLIVLGQLPKKIKQLQLVKLNSGSNLANPNRFPELIIGTDSELLLEAVENDTHTLKHMIRNYSDYIKENTALLPVLCAYEINKRGLSLEDELQDYLNKFSRTRGYTSFSHLLDTISIQEPEEINREFS